VTPRWLSAFIDAAPEEYAGVVPFWEAVTGYRLAPGGVEAWAPLRPPEGDAHLWVQRLDDGPSGVHLDLYVDDLDGALAHATEAGATLVARSDHAVLRSPGGFPFCLVPDTASRPSAPARWPDGHRSRVDQVCLDIGPAAYDGECAFWAALTGWPVRQTPRPEYRRLAVPVSLGVRVLLQRRDAGDEPVTGHLDVATDHHAAEVARLVGLGAEVAAEDSWWTVLRPPAGPALCVTHRDPLGGSPG
jgi:hypothetical protein